MSGGTLVRALGLRRGQAAAAVGAGGKTSLLSAIAAECHAAGWRPALFTTTTKIFAPDGEAPLLLGEAPALFRVLSSWSGDYPCPVTLARSRLGETPDPAEPSRRRMKLDGFTPEEASAFRERAGMLLIEADGARGLPIKAPGPEEPVIPPWADVVLGVVGLTIIGVPLDETHVFRADAFGRAAGLAPGAPIGPEAIGRLALHPEGLFKGTPAGTRKTLILNQGDAVPDLEKLKQIAYITWSIAGAPRGPAESVVCTTMRGGARVLHQHPAA